MQAAEGATVSVHRIQGQLFERRRQVPQLHKGLNAGISKMLESLASQVQAGQISQRGHRVQFDRPQ